MPAPELEFHPLHRADGSVAYSLDDFAILGAVHAPLDAPRRDELPDRAAIDVHVRPATNAGGAPRERQLEGLVLDMLREIVLVRSMPRMLVLVVLQIEGLPEELASVSGSSGGAQEVRLRRSSVRPH